MQAYIYLLVDPVARKAMYVGKADNVPVRIDSHWQDRLWYERPLYRWMRTLDEKPPYEILEVVPIREWRKAERKWIAEYRRKCPWLLNCRGGGGGPLSAEEKAYMGPFGLFRKEFCMGTYDLDFTWSSEDGMYRMRQFCENAASKDWRLDESRSPA